MITEEQIMQLQDGAITAGDSAMVYITNTALGRTEGDRPFARALCERVIAEAADMAVTDKLLDAPAEAVEYVDCAECGSSRYLIRYNRDTYLFAAVCATCGDVITTWPTEA